MHIIKPTFTGYGTDGWMLPEVTFNRGFCSYDCNRCTQVCPSMALERIPLEEKKLTQIGKAHFIGRNCVVLREGTDCGACDEHCPTKAVHMVPFGNKGLRRPVIDEEQCIGCGACESICPVTPHRAIQVIANTIHQTAELPPEEESQKINPVDFGF
jgi:formate hydrogenlyase subunit 6/NADH:ubiquinone oxidoreductase subunit I